MADKKHGESSNPADVGLIGLAVMGQNLALNIADNGFSIAVHNRTTATTQDFVSRATSEQDVRGYEQLGEFVAAISRPRKILLLVRAGSVVDRVVDDLLPHLDPGDIIIDCGNSLHSDSTRRLHSLAGHGVRFVGCGVSGGEEGARFGPSVMPGGDPTAWPELQPILQAVAAKAGPDADEPCCAWLGGGGAGHFVKMVHNGIEYGDMQVLAEAHVLLRSMGQAPKDVAETFRGWNEGRLQSYLVEITGSIMDARDDGKPMVDLILDAAGQKGTGKWTVMSAMELGQPLMLVAEAVGARMLSSFVDTRQNAAGLLDGPSGAVSVDLTPEEVEHAVYAAKLISYAQGFMLLGEASEENGWDVDLGAVAGLWRAGCIIRAAFLDDVSGAYRRNPDLENLLFDPGFAEQVSVAQSGLRSTVGKAAAAGVPTPALSSALAFYDGLRLARGSASLIQAQRDFFGAHTFERIDRPRGQWYHRDWAETGAAATSGSYSA